MKTKSKRFLNLATLCLALLGTTLLMTCPVKAEIVSTRPQSGENSTLVSTPEEDSTGEETEQAGDDAKKDWRRGYNDGYKVGQKSDNRGDIDRDNITVPRDVTDEGEYKDGYEGGFGAGWQDSHPFQAILEAAISFLSYVFGSLFQ
ncbi:TPA: hypothetical protein VNH35_000794 [Streptococcus pyogenes]|nr:hypothetical protein [Streptococcus pyogenes]